MKSMRMLGNQIQRLAQERDTPPQETGRILDCSEEQVFAIYEGRVFPSFDQLEKLAEVFQTTVGQLLDGDAEDYERSVVHCMGQFSDSQNREEILDIIDDYLTLKTAVDSEGLYS